MILPTKHISADKSLLGVGALLLRRLDEPRTVTGLWEAARGLPTVGTFERFVLALDLLYAIGALEMHEGLLHARRESSP
mgnify:CR=1 FL=1